jgi:hypothetical protein
MSNNVRAKIRFLTTAEGGRRTPAQSGVRPHLKLGDVFTTCIIRSLGPDSVFELGRVYEVTLEIVFWEQYGHLLREDEPLRFFDGDRLVAQGEVIAPA